MLDGCTVVGLDSRRRNGNWRSDERTGNDGVDTAERRVERGVITPFTYTMLVLMTIATTLMAYPLFGVVYRRVNPLGRIARVDAPLTHPSP